MVTPIVFDYCACISNDDWNIIKTFGSPGHEYPEQNKLIYISSLFPSSKQDNKTKKGGILLIKLKPLNSTHYQRKIDFKTTYRDRFDKEYVEEYSLKIPDTQININNGQDYFQSISIRKAILLVRYVNFMKNYLRDAVKKSKQPSITIMSGILIPEMITKRNNDHQKIPMRPLDENWVSLFSAFISYFRAEMEIINDIELNKIWKQLMTIYDLEKDNRPISIEKPREIIYPELNNKSGHRVFISYCNTQKDDVEKIKAVLEKK